MERVIASTDIIKLAAMECAASCILTGLHLSGMNYRYFLLGYWNLTFYARTLMSGGSLLRSDLEYIYGFQLKYVAGSEQDMISFLRMGNWTMLACQASKLAFFPRNMLGFESEGFVHFILVYGYDQATGKFKVIDPIADFIGEMSGIELRSASADREDMHFYASVMLDRRDTLTSEDIFYYQAKQNLHHYCTMQNSGHRAIDMFSQALVDSMTMPPDELNVWIEQNNITISSILKTRSIVWKSFCDLNLLKPEEVREGDRFVDEISKLWMGINFLLMKIKRSPSDASLRRSVHKHLEAVGHKERACLEFIYRKGCELCAV